jgi:hypothetical protein
MVARARLATAVGRRSWKWKGPEIHERLAQHRCRRIVLPCAVNCVSWLVVIRAQQFPDGWLCLVRLESPAACVSGSKFYEI